MKNVFLWFCLFILNNFITKQKVSANVFQLIFILFQIMNFY